MKYYLLFFLLLFFGCQRSDDKIEQFDTEKTKEEVLNLCDNFFKAIENKNTEALKEIISNNEDVIFNISDTISVLKGKTAALDYYNFEFKDKSNIKFGKIRELRILLDKNFASVFIEIPYKYEFAGNNYNEILRFNFTFRKENNFWKLVLFSKSKLNEVYRFN